MADNIADCSIDAIVTDPPYGLGKEPDMAEVLRHWLAGDDYKATGGGFMGKTWDSFVPGPAIWKEAYRCLKPGGYMLVFAGSRTQDLMATSLRLAGFEIRDTLMWLYSSGFPKSLDVSKAIDKRLGAEREVIGHANYVSGHGVNSVSMPAGRPETTAPATAPATAYSGYGTALKPAYEPIIVCRKPLNGTVANNVLTHGTGGINIDGCRVPATDSQLAEKYASVPEGSTRSNTIYGQGSSPRRDTPHEGGRWPANVMHDGCLPEPMDRYFYHAKTSKKDRDAGLEMFDHHNGGECTGREDGAAGTQSPRAGAGRTNGSRNIHPTVKPTELMRWCCRLVGHPGAVIMDPFSGSGSTGRGAVLEGFGFIGFEMSDEYCEIANARVLDALVNKR